MSRSNILFLIIGALVIAVAVMGYELYQDRKQPEGMTAADDRAWEAVAGTSLAHMRLQELKHRHNKLL